MNADTPNTRARLIKSAARLFRTKGYHGTGLTELLADSHAPKGSLYHHFPKGKSDLALATATWVSNGMLQVIDDAFLKAQSFEEGATNFCYKLAKLFDLGGEYQSCPITGILFDDPDNTEFRQKADAILSAWQDRVTAHGEALGLPADTAHAQAALLVMTFQGGWTLARARRDSNVIRQIPGYLYKAD